MPLGTRIRKAREQARISQAELARRIGISKTAMNAIEGGATDPRASRIVAIAQVLVDDHRNFDRYTLLQVRWWPSLEENMGDKYLVDLTDAEQECLFDLIKKGKTSVRKVTRAHILLQAAEEATDEEIAEALRVGVSTVHRTRQRFVEEGLPAALTERARCGCGRKLDGKQEAFLVALACSTPPPGRDRWTMQLLADRFVEFQVVEQVSDETVRRVLKKTISSRGREKNGAFPV
jgi:putative transposase